VKRKRVLVAMYYEVTAKNGGGETVVYDGRDPYVNRKPKKLIFRRTARRHARALKFLGCADARIVRVNVYGWR
jgi:hypothetical protein